MSFMPEQIAPKTSKGVDESLWSIGVLAEYLDVPEWTIRKWRAQGTGPPGLRVGRHVRYRPADVRRWLDELAAA